MMLFSSWLLAQSGRDDPVGDLAGDVRRDPPTGGWGVKELRRHMHHRGACGEALAALSQAYSEWNQCCGSRTGGDRMAP